MDEPTSGLDARAAAVVMRTVRNTVDTGRTVVCTIHQPSIDIFESFDEVSWAPLAVAPQLAFVSVNLSLACATSWASILTLYPARSAPLAACFPPCPAPQLLLLQRGGRVMYNGPLGRNSQAMINYFQVRHRPAPAHHDRDEAPRCSRPRMPLFCACSPHLPYSAVQMKFSCTLHSCALSSFAFSSCAFSLCALACTHASMFPSGSQSIASVPPIQEGCNPATWVLEVSAPCVQEKLQTNLADEFESSQAFK